MKSHAMRVSPSLVVLQETKRESTILEVEDNTYQYVFLCRVPIGHRASTHRATPPPRTDPSGKAPVPSSAPRWAGTSNTPTRQNRPWCLFVGFGWLVSFITSFTLNCLPAFHNFMPSSHLITLDYHRTTARQGSHLSLLHIEM